MRTMLSAIILTLTLAFSAFGQRVKWPPTTEWYSVHHTTYPFKWEYTPANNNVAVIPVAQRMSTDGGKDRWVNHIMTRSVQGNIIGKTITITLEVNAPNNFISWDEPTTRRDVRIFILGYDTVYASSWLTSVYAIEDYTQWCRTSVPLVRNVNGAYLITLTAVATWNNFSNSVGQSTVAGFERCAIDANQIGVCISGGRYYSTGLATAVGSTAPNTIRIVSFSVQ